MTNLERELQSALLALHRKWKTVHYYNSWFLEMVTETRNTKLYKGPLRTVRDLLASDTAKAFRVLGEAGKAHWTVEFLILEPKWKGLFTEDELRKAHARLAALG
jgi:hypothetical protein